MDDCSMSTDVNGNFSSILVVIRLDSSLSIINIQWLKFFMLKTEELITAFA